MHYRYYAIYYTRMTHLFYNWKFVPFDPLPSPPTLVFIPKKTDCENNQRCSPVQSGALQTSKCRKTLITEQRRTLKSLYGFMLFLLPGCQTHSSVSAYRTHRP